MRRVLLASLLILAAAPARAEDFSGFYAGINGGYASGTERTRGLAAPVPGPSPGAADTGPGPDLPPSARGAAAAMRPHDRAPLRGAAHP